jgi:hypothetical protein
MPSLPAPKRSKPSSYLQRETINSVKFRRYSKPFAPEGTDAPHKNLNEKGYAAIEKDMEKDK